ncbi:hypothetical protein H0H93_008996 [Arthromyces matolae]|nr:hypothetical protein H0H93_008996 [Arthromyces matolae]
MSKQSALLLRAVSIHGKCWTKIVKSYFPGRTALSAKNQSVTRVEATDCDTQSTSYSPVSELAIQDIPFDTLEDWSAAMLPLETGDWELDFSQKITSSELTTCFIPFKFLLSTRPAEFWDTRHSDFYYAFVITQPPPPFSPLPTRNLNAMLRAVAKFWR